MRILNSVHFFSEAGVAIVVETAEREVIAEQVVPDLVIVPVENGKDARERRPAGAAGAYGRQVFGPRVSPPVAHQDDFYFILVNQSLDLTFEVGAE